MTYEILIQHGNASHLVVIEAESISAAYAQLVKPQGATVTLLGMIDRTPQRCLAF